MIGVATLVVLGAVAGVAGLLLASRRRRPAGSTAVLLGVALAFAGGFSGYFVGPKGGSGAFLTASAWAGASLGAALAIIALAVVSRTERSRSRRP
ncbi:hypothetical protein SAMN06264364_12733 [Quadrisphaera granulorum]|uniref:Uncharacterized protein n=1 Tax=Quadrisphaera granulorum TaxID=317664 RepID=A0A315ZUN7_9ACTN|nr:hypothetical protein BXY45_12733 [Quadrisphaera granulorum]SZE98252.1 hypothetical protein SAMN06264364_12733 [Quadrisphaera granulorum]